MRKYRLGSPPRSLKRSTLHLDNVALVPASLLPLNSTWQAIVNSLPQDEMLVVLPNQTEQQRVAQSVASHLQAKGKHVKVMDTQLQRSEL